MQLYNRQSNKISKTSSQWQHVIKNWKIIFNNFLFHHVRISFRTITHLKSILLCGTITYVERSTYKVILNIDDEESIDGTDNLRARANDRKNVIIERMKNRKLNRKKH